MKKRHVFTSFYMPRSERWALDLVRKEAARMKRTSNWAIRQAILFAALNLDAALSERDVEEDA